MIDDNYELTTSRLMIKILHKWWCEMRRTHIKCSQSSPQLFGVTNKRDILGRKINPKGHQVDVNLRSQSFNDAHGSAATRVYHLVHRSFLPQGHRMPATGPLCHLSKITK